MSQGTVTKAVPLTKEAVDLTLSGVTQDGSLTLTIPAGSILDPYGVGNIAFSGSYIIQVNSPPFPTPFSPADPAGSLIYDPSVSGAINFNGDTDTYTLPLAANQSLTMVLAVDPNLIGAVQLLDPGGHIVGSAVGSGPGSQVVLQTAPVATAGTYSLVVTGAGHSGQLHALGNSQCRLQATDRQHQHNRQRVRPELRLHQPGNHALR